MTRAQQIVCDAGGVGYEDTLHIYSHKLCKPPNPERVDALAGQLVRELRKLSGGDKLTS